MINRAGLTVFVHPRTGDDVEDHDTTPLWMGEALALDIEFLRRHGRG
jgi:DOPA 4,5-dioxygenase